MKKKGSTGIERGQAITFRLPSDTPDHILRQLQKLKETERRNFSSKMAEYVLEGVSHSLSQDRETVTIPLPKQLSKEQRNWLKHSHSEALLGSIVYQLLADPMRATSVLAALNSSSLDIDEALYLQEIELPSFEDQKEAIEEVAATDEVEHTPPRTSDDELMNFDWSQMNKEQAATEELEDTEEEDADDLLGDFLSRMNK
ncbi:hypothetical protein M3689_15665 [Alkalihalophilus marmarensis]|uniref:Uncharacterized protein n=1 Tax=Alkalihalophilus marmarensis DSM 21297 TaxID=1188261 RepID=U6SJL7_9BACI|nr:hypothetical protein [Alkalihalophilus marmarensis]ERN51582.1 hypothetical protein A33I_19815 [Alkalihalophilus marmarensis DSM 21297]MCM3490751.1 hypothetical protein [Alkalihalophilus marmarensis]